MAAILRTRVKCLCCEETRRARRPFCERGPSWEPKNSLSSFVLLDVPAKKTIKKKAKQERERKKNYTPVFLNTLYESYQTTDWLRFRIGEILGDFSTNFSLPLCAPQRLCLASTVRFCYFISGTRPSSTEQTHCVTRCLALFTEPVNQLTKTSW